MTNDFKTNNINEYSEVPIAWGIQGIDRSNFVRWEPNDFRGVIELKESKLDVSSQLARNI